MKVQHPCLQLEAAAARRHGERAALFNLALNKAASADETDTRYGYSPTAAVDGNLGTLWAAASYAPQWLKVDLGQAETIDRIVVYGPHGIFEGLTLQYDLVVSTDDNIWPHKGTGTLVDSPDPALYSNKLDFEPTEARYILYSATGGSHWTQLYELQAFNTTAVPEPSAFGLATALAALTFAVRRRALRNR